MCAKVGGPISHEPLDPSPRTITIVAISNKGRSRIGKSQCRAVVEQTVGGRIFVVWPELGQCRWVLIDNDPDFVITG